MNFFPINRLKEEHYKHYAPGTWDLFFNWFNKSGYGSMLDNPYLNQGDFINSEISWGNLDSGLLRGIKYQSVCNTYTIIKLRTSITSKSSDLREIFDAFVKCTAHTHLSGDFRKYVTFFTSIYTGPRYILFDGAGTCLLLGAMIQSLSKRLCAENVALHYSCTPKRELTHVFASWSGFFVDADQKTWVRLEDVENAALYGYLFQQLGVSAYQIYLSIAPDKNTSLFTKMARDYFTFYDDSRTQYMYKADQSVQVVSDYFKVARETNCSNLSLDSNDFPWKQQFRLASEQLGIKAPYFLAQSERPIPLSLPPNGSFEIGLYSDHLPHEAFILSSIFLGRIPGVITAPASSSNHIFVVPEYPWMVVFDLAVENVTVNNTPFSPWVSACGKFRLLGMGDLETCFDLNLPGSEFRLEIGNVPGSVAVILPFNAFALASGHVIIEAENQAAFKITGQVKS